MLQKRYEKDFFGGLTGETFFDTQSDGSKQFFFLGPIWEFLW